MRTDGPVVIALAHSPHTEDTLAWGITEAVRMDRPVRLVGVVDLPREAAMWAWAVSVPDATGAVAAKGYLDGLADREQGRRPDLRVSTAVLQGVPAAELRAESQDASLLVVGAGGRGRGRVSRVAAHVAAHAQCPVAVVRPPIAPDGADGALSVVVGVDGSATSLGAAHVAAAAARARGARLTVVHVRPTVAEPYGPGVAAPEPPDAGPARQAADELAALLRERHPGVDVEVVVVDDDPAHALVTASGDAQLVVVGSRGLGSFPGMLLGSVSNEVVRTALCTVLVTHEVVVTEHGA